MSETMLDRDPQEREPSFSERLGALAGSFRQLLSTRAEIFGEEASQKAVHLAVGVGLLLLAVAVAGMLLLLFTALLVALLTLLFGPLWAGILATLVLYGAAAAVAATIGVKSLSKVRPTEFPVTQAELSKDWEALRKEWRFSANGDSASSDPEDSPAAGSRASEPPVDDFETRFREGSE